MCLISVVYLSGVLEKVRKWRENSIFREEVCALTLELKKLITHTFDPEHLEEAILCQMGSESIKVLVKPSQDD